MRSFKFVTSISIVSLLIACGGNSGTYISAMPKPGIDPPKKDEVANNIIDSNKKSVNAFSISQDLLNNKNSNILLNLVDGNQETISTINLFYDEKGANWSTSGDEQSRVVFKTDGKTNAITSAYGFVLPVNGKLIAFNFAGSPDADAKAVIKEFGGKLLADANAKSTFADDGSSNFVGGDIIYTGSAEGVTIGDDGSLLFEKGTFNFKIDFKDLNILGEISSSEGDKSNGAFGSNGLTFKGKVENDYYGGTLTGTQKNGEIGNSDLLGQFQNGGRDIVGSWNGDFTGGLQGSQTGFVGKKPPVIEPDPPKVPERPDVWPHVEANPPPAPDVWPHVEMTPPAPDVWPHVEANPPAPDVWPHVEMTPPAPDVWPHVEMTPPAPDVWPHVEANPPASDV